MKKHLKALVFFAVSKQIPIVYSADRGQAEIRKSSQCYTMIDFILNLGQDDLSWSSNFTLYLGDYLMYELYTRERGQCETMIDFILNLGQDDLYFNI